MFSELWWDGAVYERGFSLIFLYKAKSDTPAVLTTLKRTPGISPLDLPIIVSNKKPELGQKNIVK